MPHPDEASITQWLTTQQDNMLALLADIVDIDSGTYNKPGTDAVGARLQQFLEAHNIQVERIAKPRHGDCLRATVTGSPGTNAGNILLMGHRDTVFPDGETGRRPFRISDGKAYGPGVYDMKAGLVMNCFLLAAFQKFGGAPAPLVGLFTADEEIGSPEGRPVIEAEARKSRAVFNSEGAPLSGNVVTQRKGARFSKFTIAGKAAHSGSKFSEGISAIEELALKIHALHQLTDIAAGITLNVGLVSGGQSINTIAPSAEGQIDLRYIHRPDLDTIMPKIAEIIATSYVPGTTAELTTLGEFLPLTSTQESEALLNVYATAAAHACAGEFDGGCADSGFAAATGAPTICSVGPLGANAHSPDEYMLIDSLVPRTITCARAIMRLGGTRI